MEKTTILDKIIARKHVEISQRSEKVSFEQLEKRIADRDQMRGFITAIRNRIQAQQPAVIAEIKKASPSKGLIRADFDPVALARSYADAGATCLSVLTDEEFFQGSTRYLQQARAACELPVLRKDFIVDPYQIAEASLMQADCILLIVAALNPEQLRSLAAYARSIDMDILVEVHNEAELDIALNEGFDLIGINNRNLHDFHTDLDTTYRLARIAPADVLLVTESGINSAEDVRQMIEKGIYGFLIGETFMRAPDPGNRLREFFPGL
jgi:indole-3-glycerol phosphate synthase